MVKAPRRISWDGIEEEDPPKLITLIFPSFRHILTASTPDRNRI